MIELTPRQKKDLHSLLIGLVNKSSVQLLRTVNAEQKQMLDLFLSNPDWGAWRVQAADAALQELLKVVGVVPTKRKTKRKVL